MPITPADHRDIPDQLADLLIRMIPEARGEELGDAFRIAAEFPPITKQSLSELDIQNIISNIKLRHDINFDRDLSFRPNTDGAKGHEKKRASSQYWLALEAELELYVRLYCGTPSLFKSLHVNWSDCAQYAKRRIPKVFETIQDVLKSLVPDRDHSRVEEHLDVSMLMQEIEKGVCDLVRLAEWMAHLLKEHCAPMRDEMVDNMVDLTRLGVADNKAETIVEGLKALLGILEAMKLDVANHQIRNLKTLLIEDTINFEKHYHLDRLVKGHSRINIEVTQEWYSLALGDFRQQCTPPPKDNLRFQLDVFTRAVVSTLFFREKRTFPETFYLDHDRLRTLKTEIDDLVFFEICFELFGHLLKQYGYDGPVSPVTRRVLRTSLSAIIGEGTGHASQQWMRNSEHISLELMRQAYAISNCPPNWDLDDVHNTNHNLRAMLHASFEDHAALLETYMLPQVLTCVNRHLHSSPTDLFNSLVPGPSSVPHPPPPFAPSPPTLQSLPPPPSFHISTDTLLPPPEQYNDITNRITHIILLHWRIWGHIAYVQEDESPTATSEEQLSTSHTPQPRPSPPGDADAPVVTAMKTGEPPDPSQETHIAHEASLP
ncbi:T-complex protein 11-domain-containing protein [Massariosphaeria phaeospora]|uniref:T-complex protein 11-domain-containing protein n=1 Tax=Massariosphaeria phaeospora TaxID=100035 RepID=A0A7C8MM43_9PLEO|nr:T-complex protein 11-domain-containing protein [Massariosphaeria phaeospora]